MNPKYPGGLAALRKHLEDEGHTVAVHRERAFVDHLDSVIWTSFTL